MRPTDGCPPAPRPFGRLVADVDSAVSLDAFESLRVRVDRYELDALDAGLAHRRIGIAATTADADDLDVGQPFSRLRRHHQCGLLGDGESLSAQVSATIHHRLSSINTLTQRDWRNPDLTERRPFSKVP